MCLSSTHSRETTQQLLPQKPFYAYKYVDRRGDQLVSPLRHYVWKPGELVGDTSSDHHAGFYLMLVKPGPDFDLIENQQTGKRIVRVLVKPEDVKASGPDSFNGHSCTCIVVRKVYLTKRDHEDALSGERQRFDAKKLLEKAKKTREESRKQAEKDTAQAEKTRAKAKKSVKKGPKDEFDGKTVGELKAMCKAAGITGYSSMNRGQLADALTSHEKATKRKSAKKTAKANKKTASKERAQAKKTLSKSAKAKTKPTQARHYDGLSMVALKKIARGHELSGYSKLSRDELVKLICHAERYPNAHKTVKAAKKKAAKTAAKKGSEKKKAPKKSRFEGLGVGELRTLAKAKKIPGASKMKKADLIKALS